MASIKHTSRGFERESRESKHETHRVERHEASPEREDPATAHGTVGPGRSPHPHRLGSVTGPSPCSRRLSSAALPLED